MSTVERQPPGWIDTHLHVWDQTRTSYPWLRTRSDLPAQSLTPPERQRLRVGAIGALLVEAGASPEHRTSETAWLCDIASTAPGVLGVIAAADWRRPADLESVLSNPRIVGVRITVNDTDPTPSTTNLVAETLSIASLAGIAVDILCGVEDLVLVERSMTRAAHASRRVIIDHAPNARGRDQGRLARLVNEHDVFLKISGDAIAGGTPATRCESLAWVTDSFPTSSVMLGSDWPVSGSGAGRTYGDWMSDPTLVSFLTPQLLRATAERAYGLATRHSD